jgi:hypothetical protein
VICFASYLYLGLYSGYYLTLVDVIAVLYVGRFIVLSWRKATYWNRITIPTLAAIIVFHDVLSSAFFLYARKNVIYAKANIASVIKARFEGGRGQKLRLFFPFASPYLISEFASYLNYRGVPVEAGEGDGTQRHSVVLATTRTRVDNGRAVDLTRDIAENGHCVGWTPFWCHSVSGAAPGDLVIVLPDDEVSPGEVAMYREEKGKLLFYSEPWPRIPDKLISIFLSPSTTLGFEHEIVPDRWLTGSVTIWK